MLEVSSIFVHPFIQFIGRFHPLIIHLPIGFLIIAYIMAVVGYFNIEKKSYLNESVPLVLFLGLLSAIIATTTGFILSRSGSYELEAIMNHQLAGIFTTLLAIVTYIFRHKKLYLPLFTVTILSIFISGHLGGELTHGKGFITKVFISSKNKSDSVANEVNLADISIYPHVIAPLLEDNCQSCHNKEKPNNELNLETFESLIKGGVSGPIVAVGNASASEIIRRISLSGDDDDAMPPKGKKKLNSDEIELLKIWIDTGLPNNVMVADLDPRSGMKKVIQKLIEKNRFSTEAKYINVPKASPPKINQLIEAGFAVTPIVLDYPQLQVSYFNRQDTITKAKINLLKSVAQQIVQLDLSGANILDWRFLSRFNNLVKLHLKNTSISDKDLQNINSENLTHLNLFGTSISEESINSLVTFDRLKMLYIGETEITLENISTLKNTLLDLSINLGEGKESILKGVELPTPSFALDQKFIDETSQLKLNSSIEDVEYYYSFDSTIPMDDWEKLDRDILDIDRSVELNIYAKKEGWQRSKVLKHTVFFQTHKFKDVVLSPDPSNKYFGKGAASINDKNLGSIHFDDGTWLGYEGENAEIDLAFHDELVVKKISLNMLIDSDYWIFPPEKIEVFSSNDGQNYKKIAMKFLPDPQLKDENFNKTISFDLYDETAKFLKLKIVNRGLCPDWHQGRGKKAWIFFNEVIVE
ncbi:MAG: hypothetical protein HOA15_07930 [Candidatus Marinimicrobia bacterium]|jgi:uncharacterized membrane protein|nr:hypothetical protein [Candidatus Neomarinimicrobiota bacterium]MBT3676442.1 hypothetical protein [Candidatus Neomarinimicrobiota bacterium]MBT3762638.1 hypothetical protein [Candidatus Neomarinimicrobiota bacterium]MBT4068470.1 hypothetical protein [Candidatus Neomarinimicrobiota bacterium]MBT4270705.1 hypothetical protein [Candidatus Neomarinimicrobiota bacterium]